LVVILTVLYLALQIRQNVEQTRLSSIQATNASNDTAFDPVYIPENSRIWTRGHSEASDLDDHERSVFDMLMARLMGSFDTTTYQYEKGAYDLELYRGAAMFRHWGAGLPRGTCQMLTGRDRREPASLSYTYTAGDFVEACGAHPFDGGYGLESGIVCCPDDDGTLEAGNEKSADLIECKGKG
jgi:hypothetical protein